MKTLSVDWREKSYFEKREDHYFLVMFMTLKVCKLSSRKNAWGDTTYWFEYPGMHVKALTARCLSLTDLYGTKVSYVGEPLVKGTLGGWGVSNTPYLYVYWGHVPMRDHAGKPLGYHCALPNLYDLKLN